MRFIVLVGLAVLILAAPDLAAGAPSDATPFAPLSHGGMLGAVPPHAGGEGVGHPLPFRPTVAGATASPFALFGPTVDDNVTFGGADQTPTGVVMDQLTAYAIYWVPSGYKTAPNYQSVIDGYFANEAAASGTNGNVLATATQYGNPDTDPFSYGMAFGGSAVDTFPYPADGCTEPSYVIGLKKCLTDVQLQAEVKRLADAKGWPHGHDVEFFVFTPANVGSCYDDVACSYDVYCAYHSNFIDRSHQEYVYANDPWPNQKVNFGQIYPSVCDPGQHPNGSGSYPTEKVPTPLDAADEVLDSVSHEADESITDPDGMEWWDDSPTSDFWGAETGDLCAWYFPGSDVIGHTPSGDFDQVVGTGQYYLQGEWSNASATAEPFSGCVWTYPAATAPTSDVAPAAPTGTPTFGNTLVAVDTGSWTGSPSYFEYQWDRCDASGSNCSDIDRATDNTYTTTKADVGRTLAVVVTAVNSGGNATALSDATPVVTAAFPYNTAAPTITPVDTVTVGHQLTGVVGTWGASPTRYTFVWQRCDGSLSCKTVKTVKTTQTTSSYTIVPGDDRYTIVLGVIAANGIGSTGIAVPSAPTAAVDGEPQGGSAQITGTLTGGQVIQSSTTGWSPAATSYTAVWQRCDSLGRSCSTVKTFKGGSATTQYTLRKADLGHTIAVQVTARNAAGASDPASYLTGTIAGS